MVLKGRLMSLSDGEYNVSVHVCVCVCMTGIVLKGHCLGFMSIRCSVMTEMECVHACVCVSEVVCVCV